MISTLRLRYSPVFFVNMSSSDSGTTASANAYVWRIWLGRFFNAVGTDNGSVNELGECTYSCLLRGSSLLFLHFFPTTSVEAYGCRSICLPPLFVLASSNCEGYRPPFTLRIGPNTSNSKCLPFFRPRHLFGQTHWSGCRGDRLHAQAARL